MSTLAYTQVTTKRENAQPNTSTSTSPPGVKTYVDALIASSILILLLSGCLADRMKSWVGTPLDRLTEAWGAPTSTYNKDDGGKVVTYTEMWSNQWGMHTCTMTFYVDSAGIVRGWRYNNCPN